MVESLRDRDQQRSRARALTIQPKIFDANAEACNEKGAECNIRGSEYI